MAERRYSFTAFTAAGARRDRIVPSSLPALVKSDSGTTWLTIPAMRAKLDDRLCEGADCIEGLHVSVLRPVQRDARDGTRSVDDERIVHVFKHTGLPNDAHQLGNRAATTWLRPACLASYRALSAARISASAVRPWSGNTTAPNEAVT